MFCGIAIAVTALLLWRSERKKAAVGRRCVLGGHWHPRILTLCREMQLFLLGYVVVSICEIFTVGGFPLDGAVRRVKQQIFSFPCTKSANHYAQGFSAVHIAAVVATLWILLLNGLVGFQLLDDGTPLSIGLIVSSAVILFVGTGYIALDTTFEWTGYWNDTLDDAKSYSLYTLYQLAPLVFLVVFFILETYLVIRVLGEKKPMRTFRSSTIIFHSC